MYVFTNLATSIDGKIATADRALFHLGSPEDRREMQRLRKRADAVLMGASTLRAYRGPCAVAGARAQPINVILSSELDGVSPDWAFFKRADIRRVLVVSGRVPAARLARFERSSTVIQVSPRRPIAAQAVAALAKLGVKRLLVEGGGGVMWEFARAGLIDELHVTLTPWILGGASAPTLVDGEGFGPKGALQLRLARTRRIGDELYLVYRR